MDDADIEISPSGDIRPATFPERDRVKSNAVVRFLNVQSTAPFARLKCNTNLNMPPSNWLNNSANSYGLGQFVSHHAGFSSFRMANMFPDCVGGVDVVSNAENIKRLLKLPYSQKSVISMIVHRIENTLLIDEFDVAKYLLRQEDSDWQWLRSFICENILNSLSDSEKKLFIHTKTRETFYQKYLTSKFLYYSLRAEDDGEDAELLEVPHVDDACAQYKPLPLTGPILPEPKADDHFPDPQQSNHVFNRNVIWTFEDIRMLIGTDMPIFGGANRPCISLRLRDELKPINVLTGIDYWLDNLMCNVPEVVMCYHLDGIVQRYELIKTEDLPHLENSKFSPQVIRNVAQNILAFLKSNATKAGHTYWLFKAKNDDVVKLYDLTTLCKANEACRGETAVDGSQEQEEPESSATSNGTQNPFTVPVAMLLYTVARNMKNSNEGISASKAGAIKTLLDNCIKLLPKEKYPQIVTSTHYILSDLHIPADTDPGSPKFNNVLEDEEIGSLFGERQSSPQSENELESEQESGAASPTDRLETAIKSIRDTLNEYKSDDNCKYNERPPPLLCDTEERCKIALQHIADGLSCLQYFDSYEEQKHREKEKEVEKLQIIHEETHPNMAKANDAIPLPYQPLKPEPRMANPNEAIPMAWKTEWDNGIDHTDSDKRMSKKRSKRNRKKSVSERQTISPEMDARALLLKGEIGVIKSWNVHLKILLFEKACLIYATLAELYYAKQSYGTSLRFIYAAVRCQQVVTNHISCVSSQRSLLLGRAGDCYFQFAKQWNNIQQYLDEFEQNGKIDRLIMEELVKDIGSEVESYLPVPNKNMEQLMITSCGCYETAIECSSKDSKDELRRRLGSVRNELGVKYMHWAQEEYQKFVELPPEEKETVANATANGEDARIEPLYQLLAIKSFECFRKGIELFETVSDPTNLAFLLCNMGRFMRFRAHIDLNYDTNNIVIMKKFYHDAFGYYQRALGVLGSRKEDPELWSVVTWELSTATFNLAKQLQDFSDLSTSSHQTREEVEAEVLEMLQKALKLCDQDNSGSKQVLYSFRSALIHHRIASYFHSSYRATTEDNPRKKVLQLCKLHYEKAAKIFEHLSEPQEFLQIQMERIALQEYQCELAPVVTVKQRHMQSALDLCQQAQPMIEYLSSAKSLVTSTVDSNVNCDELQKLLVLFEQRLQVILRTLIKYYLQIGAGAKRDAHQRAADHYKALFRITLQKRPASTAEDVNAQPGNGAIKEHALHLANVLRKICEHADDWRQ